MVELMLFDKKNKERGIYFVLLEKAGKVITDRQLTKLQILEAIEFYQQLNAS